MYKEILLIIAVEIIIKTLPDLNLFIFNKTYYRVHDTCKSESGIYNELQIGEISLQPKKLTMIILLYLNRKVNMLS